MHSNEKVTLLDISCAEQRNDEQSINQILPMMSTSLSLDTKGRIFDLAMSHSKTKGGRCEDYFSNKAHPQFIQNRDRRCEVREFLLRLFDGVVSKPINHNSIYTDTMSLQCIALEVETGTHVAAQIWNIGDCEEEDQSIQQFAKFIDYRIPALYLQHSLLEMQELERHVVTQLATTIYPIVNLSKVRSSHHFVCL